MEVAHPDAATAHFIQPFQACPDRSVMGLYTRVGLPAMGYDCVSPMVIHIEGFQPSLVANLRFAVIPGRLLQNREER